MTLGSRSEHFMSTAPGKTEMLRMGSIHSRVVEATPRGRERLLADVDMQGMPVPVEECL